MRTLLALILCCLLLHSKLINAQCHIDDWTALKALYEATDGDNWDNNRGWEVVKSDEPPLDCNLYSLHGVDLNSQSRVERLNLFDNNLSGTIPAKLKYLSEVGAMFLGFNQLRGSIPEELTSLSNLIFVDVASNLLSGDIPDFKANYLQYYLIHSNYFSCSNLEDYFNSNPVYGSIEYSPQKYRHNALQFYPIEGANESISLNAPFNKSGNFTYQWYRNQTPVEGANDSILYLNNIQPEDLGLYFLHIIDDACIEFDNDGHITYREVEYISDPIMVGRNDTKCHLDDWTALKALYEATDGENWTTNRGWEVVKNEEPPIDCNLKNLFGVTLDESNRVLRISNNNNNLNGFLPVEISKLKYLTSLRFTNNKISGLIPPEIGQLENLEDLYLHDNQLHGSIPSELGNLTNLKRLHLDNNQLTGNIPPELGSLGELHTLLLNNNKLSDNIPGALFNANELDRLELQNNQLSGSIPSEVGSLNRLDKLLLNNNQLTGNIPPQIGNLNFIGTLNLEFNLLDGSVPEEIFKTTIIPRLDLSNNQLTGILPSNMSNQCFIFFDVSHNKLSGSIPILKTDYMYYIITYDISYNNYNCSEIIDSTLQAGSYSITGPTKYSPQNYNYRGEKLFLVDSSVESISLTAPINQTGNFTYQWYKNETPVDGATDSILYLDTIQLDDVGDYTLHIYDSECKSLGGLNNIGLDGIAYISTPTTVRRTDLEGCTEISACNYDEFAMIDDRSCEYLSCDTLINPIKIRTKNETILSDTQIKFDLVIDSLGFNYSAEGLTFTLDTKGNYNIESVEVINPALSIEEVDLGEPTSNTISIDRNNDQKLSSNTPVLRIIASIVVEDIPTDESSCSYFEIYGGTKIPSGEFISFENIYIDIPFSDCLPLYGFGSEGENWLPLVTSLSPQNCKLQNSGVLEIKILEEGERPFNYTLKNEQGYTLLEGTSVKKLIELYNIAAGNYLLSVADNSGKQTGLNISVPLITNVDGNKVCNSECVDYLIIPNGEIVGMHFAKKDIEIRGFISGNETVEINICD